MRSSTLGAGSPRVESSSATGWVGVVRSRSTVSRSLSFSLSIMRSIMPRARCASALWTPALGGEDRAGARPRSAPGSASITSARVAKLEYTCPVVGLAMTVMKGSPSSPRLFRAKEALAICIRDMTPSCMPAVPLVTTATTGILRLVASSNARDTFSPTTAPMVPPTNRKSSTMSTTGLPPMVHLPVMAASVRPVLRPRSSVGGAASGSRETMERWFSRKLLGSASSETRSLAVRL